MPSVRIALALTLTASATMLPSRRAFAIEDVLTPRSVGMGNSLRADAAGALGPLLNPAAMALQRAYTIELVYGFRVQDTGSTLHLSIVDSITSRLSAGLFYTFIHGTEHMTLANGGPIVATHEGHETGTSLAVGLGDRFSFGLSLKYVNVSTVADNPFFDAKNNPMAPEKLSFDSTTSEASANGFTIDTGIALKIVDSFRVGLVGYNLIPLRSVEAPMALGMGVSYRAGSVVTLAFDTVVYFDKYHQPVTAENAGDRRTTVRLGGGLEWLIAGKVPLRVGSFWDNGRPGTYVSGGLGYLHKSFGIDASFRQQVSGGKGTDVLAGLRIFLE